MSVKISLFLLLFASIFMGSELSYAQDANGFRITGTVKDNYNEPLIMATVRINNMKDSLVQGVVTDPDGNFVANNLKPGDYKVVISYTSFQDDVHQVTIKDQNIDLGLIKMVVKQTQLATVTITDHASAVQQDGDTTSYNANSYKVQQGATAGDLISKMPGMDLSSGTPQAQGETVTKVLVDNKPFFGNDAQAALDNLPADIIDKVQVYDEKSDQAKFTGFDDGNTTKTINIVTKADKRNGVFGKVYAGYGTDETYNAGGNINSFNGNRRLSLIGMTNNVNVQNFSSQDLVGVSGSGGGRGGFSRGGGMGGGSNNFMTGQQSGISRTNSVGLNYSDN